MAPQIVEVEASAGSFGVHTCARAADGAVYCWGDGANGELGSDAPEVCGSHPCAKKPVRVVGVVAIDLALGAGTTCAVQTDTTVACWGWNGSRALGDGTDTHRPRPTP